MLQHRNTSAVVSGGPGTSLGGPGASDDGLSVLTSRSELISTSEGSSVNAAGVVAFPRRIVKIEDELTCCQM